MLNYVPITITNRSIRNLTIVIRFDKRESRLLVSAVDIAEGLWVTFESSN
jgi:hypothetical protein